MLNFTAFENIETGLTHDGLPVMVVAETVIEVEVDEAEMAEQEMLSEIEAAECETCEQAPWLRHYCRTEHRRYDSDAIADGRY